MKTRSKHPKHVKVTWIDAAGPETLDQYNEESAKDLTPAYAEDSGWILTVDDIRIVLGSEKFDDGEYRRTVIIPRVNIIEVVELIEGKKIRQYHAKITKLRMAPEKKKAARSESQMRHKPR